MSVDIDDIDGDQPPPDFQRANGAPMVMIDGKRVRHSRPSNYAKPLDDESALTNWRIDTAAVGVAHDPALQAAYVALDFEDRHERKRLRDKSIQAGRGEERADIGTALHAMSVRWETDVTFKPPSPYRESLEAYSEEMNRLTLTSEAFEQPCVNVEARASGTFDRLYRTGGWLITPDGELLPPGTLIIGDLKTNKRLDHSLGGYSVQLCIYVGAQWYDVVNDEFIDTPDINQDWAILMWMPADSPGECVAFWMDMRDGREGIELARNVKKWQRAWRSGDKVTHVIDDAKPPTDDAAIGKLTEALDATVDENPDEPVEHWIEQSALWAQARINQIRNNDKAVFWLKTQWPEGVPTPKSGGHTVDQMRQLLEHLDETEAKFEIPFLPHPNPQAGHHRTFTDPNNPPTQEDES